MDGDPAGFGCGTRPARLEAMRKPNANCAGVLGVAEIPGTLWCSTTGAPDISRAGGCRPGEGPAGQCGNRHRCGEQFSKIGAISVC